MRVAIIGLAFENFEIIRQSLESLRLRAPSADIFVIENKSDATDALIAPEMLQRLDDGSIAGYIKFDENITNNAYECAINSGLVQLADYDYVVITDLDLLAHDEWIERHISILERYPNVFSVSAPLSYDNMPGYVRDRITTAQISPTAVHEEFEVFPSGVHLTMLRRQDLVDFLAWQRRLGVHFRDRTLDLFGKERGRLSVRSLIKPVRHLTWDHMPEEGQYWAGKKDRGASLWMHDEAAPLTFFERSRTTRFFPGAIERMPNSLKWYSLTLHNDSGRDCVVEIARNWRDGARELQRAIRIPAGETAKADVRHFGLGWGSLDLDVSTQDTAQPAHRFVLRLSREDVERAPEMAFQQFMPS